MKIKPLYFDYAASTPVDPAVFAAMKPYFMEKFGNPGSLHSFGQEAVAALDRARETIATLLGAEFRDVIFTSSATEANNLALQSAYSQFKETCPDKTPKIIISAIEHESVIETARFLESCGAKLSILPVDKNGIVDIKKLKKELDDSTYIVSVMYVNNEVGSVQPIAEISDIIRNFRNTRTSHLAPYPLFHSDASQAFCYFDCTIKTLGVDLMTLSSHKMYGPKGVGALYANSNIESRNSKQIPNPKSKKQDTRGFENLNLDIVSNFGFRASSLSAVSPLIRGGGQEFGARSGTENIPAIVGMAKAVEIAYKNRVAETKKILALKNYFWQEVKKIFPKVAVNGALPDQWPKCAPHVLNVGFPGHVSQDLLTRLDLAGFAVSAGSACTARSLQASHVLTAMGRDTKHALSSIRFSFGKLTTMDEVKSLLKALKRILS